MTDQCVIVIYATKKERTLSLTPRTSILPLRLRSFSSFLWRITQQSTFTFCYRGPSSFCTKDANFLKMTSLFSLVQETRFWYGWETADEVEHIVGTSGCDVFDVMDVMWWLTVVIVSWVKASRCRCAHATVFLSVWPCDCAFLVSWYDGTYAMPNQPFYLDEFHELGSHPLWKCSRYNNPLLRQRQHKPAHNKLKNNLRSTTKTLHKNAIKLYIKCNTRLQIKKHCLKTCSILLVLSLFWKRHHHRGGPLQ